ncbi:MAG: hypothetical protein ACKO5K_17470 [Armatimonadota bacterium]
MRTPSRRAVLGMGIGALLRASKRADASAGSRLERAALPVAQAIFSICVGAPPGRRLPGDDDPLLRPGGLDSVGLRWMPGWNRELAGRIEPSDMIELDRQVVRLLDKPLRRAGCRVLGGDTKEAERVQCIEARLDCRTTNGAPRKDGAVPVLIMVRVDFFAPTGQKLAGREFYAGYDLADLRTLPTRDGR